MPERWPFVSIVVVTKNRAASLERTLQALKRLDYPHFEVLVVDDGSTDNTKAVAVKFGVRYFFYPQGYTRGRQHGLEQARGPIIASCDDDCVPRPDWLRLLVAALLSADDVAAAAGLTVNIGFPPARRFKGRGKIGRNGVIEFIEDPREADYFGSANLVLRRCVVEKVGGYDCFFRSGYEDADLCLRLKRAGFRIVHVPQAIVEHYYTGIRFKKSYLFYSDPTPRLYFYFKHFQPRSFHEWLDFVGYEGWLFIKNMYSAGRQTYRMLVARDFREARDIAVNVTNYILVRMAIPYLLWRARRRRKYEDKLISALLAKGNVSEAQGTLDTAM